MKDRPLLIIFLWDVKFQNWVKKKKINEYVNWHTINCYLKVTLTFFQVHQVVAKPETYFVVQFINHRMQGIPNHELLGVKRFSFYQTTQQRLFVIKVAVDQATLNVHAYAQVSNSLKLLLYKPESHFFVLRD